MRAFATCIQALRVLLLLATSTAMYAHDARPVAVTLTELEPALYQVQLVVPPSVEPNNQPELVWPSHCITPVGATGTNIKRCAGGLAGHALQLHYPEFNPSLAAYYRLVPQVGESVSAMLPPTKDTWTVPTQPTAGQVIRDYSVLGIEHILFGYDHLLFVFGLLVIARSAKRIVLTVTGFTVAHSITLSLSALSVVTVPIPPVEATIALSIVFLAYEISRQQQDSWTYRYPVLVSFSFGLLHGLGFASALGEIGLAAQEAVLSLLFFNVGVELGQLAFIAAVAAAVWLLAKMLRVEATSTQSTLRQRSDLVASYVIGIPASYWLLERVTQFGWW